MELNKQFTDGDGDGLLFCEDICDTNSKLNVDKSSSDGQECLCQDETYYDYLLDIGGPYEDADGDGVRNCVDECPNDANVVRNNCKELPDHFGICGPDVQEPPDNDKCPPQDDCDNDALYASEQHNLKKCECEYSAEKCDDLFGSKDYCAGIDGHQSRDSILQMIESEQKHLGIDSHDEIVTLALRSSDGGYCECVESANNADDPDEVKLLDADDNGIVDCYEDPECQGTTAGAFLDLCKPEGSRDCVNKVPSVSDNHKVICNTAVVDDTTPICADVKDSDGDGVADCADQCPANSARKTIKPHGKPDDFMTCPCDWIESAAKADSDHDHVVDCHDVCCHTRQTHDGDTEPCHRIMPGYDSNDNNVTNTHDDDKDLWHNCYDACPGGPNRDPTDPASPCAIGLAAPPVVPPVKRNVSEPIHDYEWVISVLGGVISGVVLGVITFRSDREGAAKKAASDRAV